MVGETLQPTHSDLEIFDRIKLRRADLVDVQVVWKAGIWSDFYSDFRCD
jgi:hypothetical protein